ncbi:PPOX class F420-dependent oxidoreductase [Aquipuribacter sp. MA13-6]|uniref:PPOX class F420-dependent oxidoreductase n=1 Tax=unclassified Aquipuribacter TaxID=2635084 RepID=UPI003EF04EC6
MVDTVNPASVHDLAGCEYLLLTTYTKDGRAKPTPVWAAPDGDVLVVHTPADSWKVRRVRNTPAVTLTACDARGNPRGGPVDGVAVAVDGDLLPRLEAALHRKYGWKYALYAFGARFATGRGGPAGLVVRDVPADGAADDRPAAP